MANSDPAEPLFRANKRRKVLRKRAGSDSPDDLPDTVVNNTDIVITKHAPDSESDGISGVVRFQKPVGSKKHGIAFTSNDSRRAAEEQNEEKAVVLAGDDAELEAMQSDRFVKPTGKVVVADDRHMVAYIDSKMAEMQSSAANPRDGNGDLHSAESPGIAFGNGARSVPGSASTASDQRTLQQAHSKSTRVYQRPSKRRQPPQRDQANVARDSIIDQIMQESQVPLYQRPSSETPVTDAEEIDNDAATAEAFKAQLLVELGAQKRRRPPPPAGAAKSSTIQSGPKLGGSRSQREKMRALEEAKLNTSKK